MAFADEPREFSEEGWAKTIQIATIGMQYGHRTEDYRLRPSGKPRRKQPSS